MSRTPFAVEREERTGRTDRFQIVLQLVFPSRCNNAVDVAKSVRLFLIIIAKESQKFDQSLFGTEIVFSTELFGESERCS